MAAMRHVVLMMLIAASVLLCIVAADSLDDEYKDFYANRLHKEYRFGKRSPSMGLSLAEYMASPSRGGAGNFHFMNSK